MPIASGVANVGSGALFSEAPEVLRHGKRGHWAARLPRADAMASVCNMRDKVLGVWV